LLSLTDPETLTRIRTILDKLDGIVRKQEILRWRCEDYKTLFWTGAQLSQRSGYISETVRVDQFFVPSVQELINAERHKGVDPPWGFLDLERPVGSD
jgi:hypothetical protein